MPTYTLADLMTAEPVATVRALIVAQLEADGVPVSSWPPSATGGVENLRLDMVAGAVAALSSQRIAQAVNGRILPLAVAQAKAEIAAGIVGGPGALLLRKLGRDFYKLGQRDATFTIQNFRLQLIGSAGTKTYNPGDIRARADATGNRYTSITGGTLNPGQTLDLQLQADVAGSASTDPAGTIRTITSGGAGVSGTNIAPADFTPSRAVGNSSGTMTGSFTSSGVPPLFPSIRIQIIASGEIGSAVFNYSTDGGYTWLPGGVIPPTFVIPGGATLAFTNGTPPSFIVGDTLTIYLGDAILQRGADAESPDAFGARCSNRWPALSLVPTSGKIELWAHQASPEVDRIWIDADPNTGGGVLAVIASSSGPASPAAQIAVEDYIRQRLLGYQGVPGAGGNPSPQESIVVSTAISRAVSGAGTVFVPRAIVTQVQQAAEIGWRAALRAIPMGGRHGAFVRSSVLDDILADAGASNTNGVLIEDASGTTYDDLPLNPNEVAVPAPGKTLATSMQWNPV